MGIVAPSWGMWQNGGMGFFVYILRSGDGRYYTGFTTDVERRLKMHQDGKGARFTRAFGAIDIVYQESFLDKSSALKREAEIKRWPRTKKEKLFFKDKKSG